AWLVRAQTRRRGGPRPQVLQYVGVEGVDSVQNGVDERASTTSALRAHRRGHGDPEAADLSSRGGDQARWVLAPSGERCCCRGTATSRDERLDAECLRRLLQLAGEPVHSRCWPPFGRSVDVHMEVNARCPDVGGDNEVAHRVRNADDTTQLTG